MMDALRSLMMDFFNLNAADTLPMAEIICALGYNLDFSKIDILSNSPRQIPLVNSSDSNNVAICYFDSKDGMVFNETYLIDDWPITFALTALKQGKVVRREVILNRLTGEFLGKINISSNYLDFYTKKDGKYIKITSENISGLSIDEMLSIYKTIKRDNYNPVSSPKF